MSKGSTPPRWKPLRRGSPVINQKVADSMLGDPVTAEQVKRMMAAEIWLNDQYVVIVERDAEDWPIHLSIRRQDRRSPRDWRHLQRIKNELCGAEAEAVELFPAASRLVDEANQTHLWVAQPGQTFPFGYRERQVSGPEEAAEIGAVQRPFDD